MLYNRRGVSDYVLYDEAGIFERTGVTPAQYPEYAALRGDPSDNLPGVPGIGEKTAAKLINAYGNLEGIYEHLDELPPKQRQNLGEFRDRVFLNRQMSQLKCDVEVGVAPGELRMGAWDREQVRVLFDQLAFRTLLPRLFEAVGDAAAADARRETLDVDTSSRCATRPRSREFLVGPHRRGRSVRDGSAVGRRAGHQPAARARVRRGCVRRWRRTTGGSSTSTPTCSPTPAVRDALAALVAEGGPPLVAHRAKELMHGLDLDVRTLHHDTALMAYLLDPGEGKYLLDALALRFLGLEVESPDAEPGTLDLSGDQGVEQTGRRAAAVLRLADELQAALDARELTDLYQRFELPLVRVLARMEDAGIRIDREFLDILRKDLARAVRRRWSRRSTRTRGRSST